MSADSEKFIPTKEAASLVGRTSDYVGRLAREGKIPASRIGRSWVVSKKALLEYFDVQESVKEIKKEKLSQTRKEEYKEVQKPKVDVKKSLTIFVQKLPVENLVSFAVAVFVVFGSFSLVNASGLAKFPKAALDVIHEKAVSLNREIVSATNGPRPVYLGNYVVEKNNFGVEEFEIRNVFASALEGFEGIGKGFEYQGFQKKNDYVVKGGDSLSPIAVWNNYVALGEGIVETSHVLSQAYVDLVHALGKGTLQNALAARDLSRALHRNTFVAYESGVNTYVSSLQAAPDAYTSAVYALVDQSYKITNAVAKAPLQVGNAILSSSQSIPEGNQKIGSGLRVIMPALGEAIIGSHERFVYGFVESSYTVADVYKDSIVRTGDHVGGAYASVRFDLPPKAGKALASAFMATTDVVDEGVERAGEHLAQAYIVPVVTVALSGIEGVQHDVESFSKNLASGTVAKKNLFEDVAESAQANVMDGVQNFFARLFGRGEDPVLLVNPGPAQTNVVIKEDEPAVITPGNVVQNFFATTDVNRNYVDASISSLHAALSSEIQKLTSLNRGQIIQNIQTTHVLNRIEDLTDTILRTPEIIGGTLDDVDIRGNSNFSGNTVSGNEFIGGTANFGTTTVSEINVTNNITAGGVLSVAGLTSNGVLTGPYFTATSTTATSTFAGSVAIDTDGLVYATSTRNVGIGVLSPSALLSLQNSTSTQPIATFANDSGSELFRFTNTGRLGIGTATPATSLEINGTDAVKLPVGTSAQRPSISLTGQIRYNTDTAQYEGYNGSAWLGLGGIIDIDQDTYITAEESSDEDFLRFYTAGNENLTISNTGNVGIGTSSPYAKLSVVGQAVAEYFTATSTTLASVFPRASFTSATSTDFAVSSLTSGRVPYITTGGRFTDSSALTFNGTTLTGTDAIFTRATTTNATSTNFSVSSTFGAVTGGAQAAGITVNADGYVGINNTNPIVPLDVTVSAAKPGIFRATTEPRVRFVAGGSNVGLLNGYVGDSFRVYSSSGLPLHIGANESTQLRFTTTEINVSDDLIPTANATYDLGSPSYYFDDAYLDSLTVNNLSAASTSIAGTNNASFSINSDNGTSDGEDASLVFYRGVVVPNAVITWDSSEDHFDFNQNIFIQNDNGGTSTSTLAIRAASGQTGNLFTVQDVNGLELANFGVNGYLGLGSSSPTVRLTVGTGTPSSITTGNYYNSAYVSGDLEVDGTIYGTVSGAVTPAGFTEGSVVFAGSGGTLTQDNSNFYWDNAANRLSIGTTSPASAVFTAAADAADGVFALRRNDNGQTWSINLAGNDFNLKDTTANVQALTILNATGYVGVGTTSAEYPLDVNGDFRVGEAGNSNAFFVDATNGYVGINNASPDKQLSVTSDLDGVIEIRSTQNGSFTPETDEFGAIEWYSEDTSQAGVKSAVRSVVRTTNGRASALTFSTSDTSTNDIERLRIDEDGNVGIGTSSPYAKLSVVGQAAAEYFTATSTSFVSTFPQASFTSATSTNFYASTFGINSEYISDLTGNGLSISGGQLNIATSSLSATSGFFLQNGNSFGETAVLGTNDSNDLAFETGGSTRLTIDTSGNVGIGTSTPDAVLSVAGNLFKFGAYSGSSLVETQFGDITNSGADTKLTLARGGGGAGTIEWNRLGTVDATIELDADENFTLTNNFSGGFITIASSGNVGIGTTTIDRLLDIDGDADINGNSLYIDADGDTYLNGATDDNIVFVAGGSSLFEISSGRLEINSSEIRIQDGTAIDPAINFDADRDTGIFRPGTDTFAISTGGTERVTVDASGNVGVGTSSPAFKLDVAGGGRFVTGNAVQAVGLTVDSDNDSNDIIFKARSNSTGSPTDADTKFIITGNGLVGVGTTAPSALFHVATPDSTSPFILERTGANAVKFQVLVNSNDLGLVQNSLGQSWISGVKNGVGYQISESNVFGTNDRFTIAGTTGNVGIGTSAPQTAFHIYSSSSGNQALIERTSAADVALGFKNTEQEWAIGIDRSDSNTFKIGTDEDNIGNSNRFAITTGGNVGIGTTTPNEKLTVLGGGDASAVIVGNGNALDTSYTLSVQNNGGTGDATWIEILNGVQGAGAFFGLADAGTAGAGTGDAFEVYNYQGGPIRFFTNPSASSATLRMVIDEDGNVGIGTSTPQGILHVVNSSSNATPNGNADDIVAQHTGNAGISILSGSSNEGNIYFGDIESSLQGGIKYSHADDLLSFYSGGGQRVSINSSGFVGIGTSTPTYLLDVDGDFRVGEAGNANAFFVDATNGEVGIGYANPSFELDVIGTARFGLNEDLTPDGTGLIGQILIDGNGYNAQIALDGDGLYLGHNSSARKLFLQTDETTALTIDGSQNVGIGTVSPSRDLTVYSASFPTIQLADSTSGSSSTDGLLIQHGGVDSYFINRENGTMRFLTNNTEQVRIDASGNVGIGATSVSNVLHIKNTNPVIRLEDSDGSSSIYSQIQSNGQGDLVFKADPGAASGNTEIIFEVDGSEAVRIESDGKVGVGNSAPTTLLHVGGTQDSARLDQSGTIATLHLGSAAATEANSKLYYDRSTGKLTYAEGVLGSETDYFTIDGDGKVGIGDSSPNNPLEINVANKLGATFTGTTAGEGVRVTQTDYTSGNYISLIEAAYDDGSAPPAVRIGADFDGGGSGLAFGTSNNYASGITNTALYVDSTGLVGVGTTAPAANLEVWETSGATENATFSVYSQDGRYLSLLQPEVGSGNDPWTWRTNNAITWRVDSADALTIESAGEIGINTTAPQAQLHILGGGTAGTPSIGAGTELVVQDTSSSGTNSTVNVISGATGEARILFGDTNNSSVGRIIYDNNDNELQFVTAFSQAMVINSSGYVGIGTTDPINDLVISNGGAEGVEFIPAVSAGINRLQSYNRNDSTYDSLQYNTLDHRFLISGTEVVRIDESGVVGIGTSTPSTLSGENAKVVINGSDGSNTTNPSETFLIGSGGNSRFSIGATQFSNDNTDFVGLTSYNTYDLSLRVGGVEAIRVQDSTGNVGIGTSTPERLLHVFGSSGQNVTFENDAQVASLALYRTGGVPSADTNIGRINFKAFNSVSSETGYARIDGFVTDATDGSEDGYLTFDTSTAGSLTEKVRIDSTGNVGIGTDSPNAALHAYRAATTGTDVVPLLSLEISDDGADTNAGEGPGINFYIPDSTPGSGVLVGAGNSHLGGQIAFVKTTTNDASGSGSLIISTAGNAESLTERIRVTHDGYTGIGAAPFNTQTLQVSAASAVPLALNRTGDDGVLVDFYQATTAEGSISVSGNTVSYNAFTGSHYATTNESIQKGRLVTFTGNNVRLNGNANSEILYGITESSVENSAKVLGSMLALQSPSKAHSNANPFLVMAVGNGEVWVVDEGENLEPGDYLVSSDTVGHAEKDTGAYPISHIVARVAEPVDWSTISATVEGKKHALVSVTFEQFDKPNGISVDALGNVGIGTSAPEYKLHVLGDAAATSFVNISTREEKKGITYLDEARKEDILEKLKEVQVAEYRYNYEDDNNPLRLGLIAEEAPSEILSVSGKGVDIYKLATFTLASVQELATRVESLEERVAALEAQGVMPGSGGVFSTSTLQSALSELGVLIEKGFAQFDKLAFRQLIAEKDNDGQGAAGTGTVRLGDKLVLVENKQIKASSKVFVTFTSPVVGSWFITDKANGSFRVTLDQVQTSDVTFDYFIVQTERETVPTSDTGVVDTEVPVIEVLGANPYYIITGNAFTDPGVNITDNVDQNLEYELFVDGYPAAERPLDTSIAGEHVLTYKVLDTAGNLTTATRAVVVGSGAGLGSTDTGTTTPVTTGDTGTSTPPVVEEEEVVEEVVEEVPVDEVAPVITLTGKAALKITVGDTFVDAGATATDDVDGDLTADIVVGGSVDADTVGLYTLTYTATDAAGNEASVSRIVTVEAPVEEVEEEVTEEVVE